MATISKRSAPIETDSIRIERRETIAIIEPGNGDRTMLEEAFLQAGRYIAEEARSDRGLKLQWEYGEGIFSASHEPAQMPDRPGRGWEEDE